LNAKLFKGILKGQCINNGGKHAHVVPGDLFDAASGSRSTSDEIAAADNYGDTNAQCDYFSDLGGNIVYRLIVQAMLSFSGESFAGELEQYSIVSNWIRFRHRS
jgi:hypothetical protein